MMGWFSTWSVTNKLRATILSATANALLLSGLCLLIMLFLFDRRELLERITVLSQTIATTTTAALEFGDAQTAERLLSALEAEVRISNALLLDGLGEHFAVYQRHVNSKAQRTVPPRLYSYIAVPENWVTNSLSAIWSSSPRYGSRDRTVGFIYIQASM